MKWYTLKEKETPTNKWGDPLPFLARLCPRWNDDIVHYYVVYKDEDYETTRFVEASGEQYMWFSEDEIEAWTSFEELNKDYQKEQIKEENFIG